MMHRHLQAFTMALALTLAGTAAAAGYPDHPIRMIAPFAPGGGSDVVARLVAQKLMPILGQSVVVENRPGASGIIGADHVAKAAPDGYTILMTNSALTSNPWLYKSLPYNTEKDFVPVIELASSPTLLAAYPKAPFNTVPELVAYAKQNPRHVTVGTPGAGQMSHLAAEMLEQASNAELMMVHYKGTANSLADLISGNIMMSFGTVPGFVGQIKAGKLKPIAVASAQRVPALPDVPTVAETYPGFEMTVWFGVFVPAGTPASVVQKLNAAMGEALKDPAVRSRFADEGLEPAAGTPAQFDALFRKAGGLGQVHQGTRHPHRGLTEAASSDQPAATSNE
ncbi:tripartite tricarboxylate transporter substrate binding protein [Achromobacter sp. HZ28]|uniref:Bug family tripartite tricarboxylate transporter substrate binding protein n=2 Tax=unclassified Achromobacter TaxID=2626865 RepID=UPI000B516ED7|nr:tripartite tricarboxylate transporter substrate binding protein [Achromobacter sp. HZ28]OWT70352.1 LacI family transcriptional regulator [Achromobacter sp. HZ34]OWT71892.1 LacI family transcriptional regulator [Achromobacter sp. HZ28]